MRSLAMRYVVLVVVWVLSATQAFAAQTVVSRISKDDSSPPKQMLNYHEKDCEEECQIADLVCDADHSL